MIWKLQEFGVQFTSIKRNMLKNFFWNTVIKLYRNRISIKFIGFFLLTNQRFITDNWTLYIYDLCERGILYFNEFNFREDSDLKYFCRIIFPEFCELRVS